MRVMFEPLPAEPLLKRIWRKVMRKPREQELVRVTMNGESFVIRRGVVVDVPNWVPTVAAYGAEHPCAQRYSCFVEHTLEDER